MKTKIAQGEWETQLTHSIHEIILDRGYGCFINATRATCKPAVALGETKEECEANAKLIASAPELLEALQAINTNFDIWDSLPAELQEKIYYSINKATK